MGYSVWIQSLTWTGVVLIGTLPLASPGWAQTPNPAWNFWGKLFDDAEPPFPSRRGTDRGDAPCVLTPTAAEGNRVWSDRPVFAWVWSADAVDVSQDGALLWDETAFSETTGSGSIEWLRYGAETPLEAGEEYSWRVDWSGDYAGTPDLYFEVISGEERQQIDQDLMAVMASVAGEPAETVALARAEYFAQHDLWSDFWGELLSLEEPSLEVRGVMQEMVWSLCMPPDEDG